MSQILVWDMPTRLFHWLLAAFFLAAFAITQLVSDDSSIFAIHALLGLVIGMMLLFRIVWGFVGTKYARFSTFPLSPRAVFHYLKEALAGRGKRYIGHNPGSGVAVVAMFILLLGSLATGLFMQGNDGLLGELHEVFAFAMLAVVVVHVLGVILHTIRHRENISLSMIHGRQQGARELGIQSSRSPAAAIFVLLTAIWTAGLFRNFDSVNQSTTLPILGVTVALAEAEDGSEHEGDDDD